MVKAISGNLGRRCRGRRAGVRSAMHNARQGHIDKNRAKQNWTWGACPSAPWLLTPHDKLHW